MIVNRQAQLVALLSVSLFLSACQPMCSPKQVSESALSINVPAGLPEVDYSKAIYEIPVQSDVSYQDVVDSLKSISEGMNFVNPANFPIGDHMKVRDQAPQGVLEVRAFCNLGMGADIMIDHPEFSVFAPCRVAVYEKKQDDGSLKLYLGLDRPTFDLQSVDSPTERAKVAAIKLEETLLDIMDRASKGDF